VIVKDDGEENIAIGAGVGFGKRKNDIINPNKIEKLFVLKENEKLQQLLLRIPEEHLALSEEIILYAEKLLGTNLNDHILLALTDHLSFAVEREKQGIHIKNKLLPEIKILYKKEFEIGLWAVQRIKEKTGIEMPIDEAAFIALHIHTMKIQGGDLHETVRQTSVVRDMVETIQNHLDIQFKVDDIAYERLITHLRFALSRAKDEEIHVMDEDMFMMIKQKYAVSYQCALKVGTTLAEKHGIEIPEKELGYITLHIERLRNQ
jgi:beta-glucoside operon transcriptional antiterminator